MVTLQVEARVDQDHEADRLGLDRRGYGTLLPLLGEPGLCSDHACPHPLDPLLPVWNGIDESFRHGQLWHLCGGDRWQGPPRPFFETLNGRRASVNASLTPLLRFAEHSAHRFSGGLASILLHR